MCVYNKWMDAALTIERMIDEQDLLISEAVKREQSRLRNFIRRRVANEGDVEDILQDVFSELVETYRLMKPVEHLGAWLLRVARNRMIDRFRRRKSEATGGQDNSFKAESSAANAEGRLPWEEILPSRDAGPDAAYARRLLMEELDAALDELPRGQHEVFIAHELEGRSFKEISRETGLSVNTLLSRKHYAVLHLRQRLRAIHDELEETRG